MRRVSLYALLFFALAVWTHVFLYKKYSNNQEFSQILYLPSGETIKLLSFGYDSVASDFIFLWSIQYFTGLHSNMALLPRTYEIITDLDPQYMDPYHTGALFLFYEGRNPQAGLQLLDRGFTNNPGEWILPLDAGFYCVINLKDYALAAHYFLKASRVPGAPTLVKEMLASMRYKIGDKVVAYQLWREIYESANRVFLKQMALQHIHDLKVMIDLDQLRGAIAAFHTARNQFPLNLVQMVALGYLSEMPVDPEGNSYRYSPESGKVEYSGKLLMYRSTP